MRPSTVLADAWYGLRRNKSVAVSVVLVTMISLYLLGVGLLAQQQVSQMKGYWYDRVQVSIYMCTDTSAQPNCSTGAATQDQRESVAAQLEEMEPLVKDVYWESEEEAYSRFKQDYKNSPLAGNIRVGDIPPSYRVQLSDPEEFETVASAFEGAPGVASVPNLREVFSPLFRAINIVTAVMVGLAALTLVSAVLLMATTIRQAAFTRRREIAIMKLVGASNRTIRTPFILETLVAGLVGHGEVPVGFARPMQPDQRGPGVGVDVVRSGALRHADRDGAVGGDHVLHEEGRVRHHRPPTRLVPAKRAIGKDHLEMAVVVHVRRDVRRQAQAHAADLHRGGFGDLAHDVDVVHAAVDDRRGADAAVGADGQLHQRL